MLTRLSLYLSKYQIVLLEITCHGSFVPLKTVLTHRKRPINMFVNFKWVFIKHKARYTQRLAYVYLWHFIEYELLRGSEDTPAVWGQAWNPMQKCFRAFQRAKWALKTRTLTVLSAFSSKIKFNTVNPVLSDLSKRRPKLGFKDILPLNAGQSIAERSKGCAWKWRSHYPFCSDRKEDRIFFIWIKLFFISLWYLWIFFSNVS